jgi:hypothetical protein
MNEEATTPGKLSDAAKIRAEIDASTNRYLFAMLTFPPTGNQLD